MAYISVLSLRLALHMPAGRVSNRKGIAIAITVVTLFISIVHRILHVVSYISAY